MDRPRSRGGPQYRSQGAAERDPLSSIENIAHLPRTPLSPRPMPSRKTSSNGSHGSHSIISSAASHHSNTQRVASPRPRERRRIASARSDATLKGDSQTGHVTPLSDLELRDSKEEARRRSTASFEPSRPASSVSASVPPSPISASSAAFDASRAASRTGGEYSSTDAELETASEGPGSLWNARAGGHLHHRKSSSLGSRSDLINATNIVSLLQMNKSAPRRSISSVLSQDEREELRDGIADYPPPSSRLISLSPTRAEEPPNAQAADLAQSVSAQSLAQDLKKAKESDENSSLVAPSVATFDTAAEMWQANFWAVVTDPKTGHAFFYNPGTAECRWAVPAGTIVLPCNPEGDWMEFFDESHGLPYYYHTRTQDTRWEKPEGFVIPLSALQSSTAASRRPGRTRLPRLSSAPTPESPHHESRRETETRRHSARGDGPRLRRRDLVDSFSTNQTESASHDAVDSPYKVLRNSRKQAVTVGRNRLLSDALAEARRAGNTTNARSRIVRQRSAVELSESQRTRDQRRSNNALVSPAAGQSTHKQPRKKSSRSGLANKQTMPRDDSGVVLLDDYSAAQGPPRSPAKGILLGASNVHDSDSDYRTPFTSTLNSIREQSGSGSSNSLATRPTRSETENTGRPNGNVSPVQFPRVGTLLTIPAPPPSGARMRLNWVQSQGGKNGLNAPPPLSPAESIDMMTLSSYGDPGPVRRPRDPEKRKSKAASPELRFVCPSPETPSSQMTGSPQPGSQQDQSYQQQHASQLSLDRFAMAKLAARKKGIFHKKVDPRELLRWGGKGSYVAPLLPLDKDMRSDAISCAKVILRLCGERVQPVFYPKVPPVAVSFTRHEGKSDGGRPHSSSGGSGIASYQASDRHRRRCIQDKQTAMAGEGSSLLEEQRWLLESCITKMQLRDEVFCGLITRLEPRAPPSARFRAWQFLGVVLSSVAPVDAELKECLASYTTAVANDTEEHESVRTLAQHCLNRLVAIQKLGPRIKAPTLLEIQAAWEAAFQPAVFGQRLDKIMRSQAHAYPATAIPIVLPFLVQTLFALEATSVHGIFRLSGDVEKLVELRLRMDRGHYSLKGVLKQGPEATTTSRRSDALTVAGLFRLFLRELEEPLLPDSAYNASLLAAAEDDVSACVEIVRDLPTIHRRVLLYVVAVLQHFARRDAVRATGVDDAELSQIFAPAIFRCPSTEIAVISTNARFEARFVQLLISHLPCDAVDLDYQPNVEKGLEGQNISV